MAAMRGLCVFDPKKGPWEETNPGDERRGGWEEEVGTDRRRDREEEEGGWGKRRKEGVEREVKEVGGREKESGRWMGTNE